MEQGSASESCQSFLYLTVIIQNMRPQQSTSSWRGYGDGDDDDWVGDDDDGDDDWVGDDDDGDDDDWVGDDDDGDDD